MRGSVDAMVKKRLIMYFRKLFVPKNLPTHASRQTGYLEGRGSYPESREDYPSKFTGADDRFGPMRGEHAEPSVFTSTRSAPTRSIPYRRRMPLTTLDALVQIKVNGLALSSGSQLS